MKIPLRRYWSLLRTYLVPLWPKVLLLSLLLGAAIGLQLYTPRILQRFIDAALGGAPSPALTGYALLFLALALCLQLLQAGATYISRDLGWRATNELRADLTRHTLGLDLAFHKVRTPGEMIERIDGDVTVLVNFFSQFTVQVFSNVVLFVYGIRGSAGVLSLYFLRRCPGGSLRRSRFRNRLSGHGLLGCFLRLRHLALRFIQSG